MIASCWLSEISISSEGGVSMRNGRKILDMHMHVFDKIDGKSVGGKTVGLKDGKIRTGILNLSSCRRTIMIPVSLLMPVTGSWIAVELIKRF